MSTEGRQGLGFEYEDEIRTSSLIHMYANENFLDNDDNLISVVLGGSKNGYLTDDLIIETKNKKTCIQLKLTIKGPKDQQFISFIENAYIDYKKDNVSYYYLVSNNINENFKKGFNNLKKSIDGSSCTEDFQKTTLTKQEQTILKDLSSILKVKNIYDLYDFFKKIDMIEKTSDIAHFQDNLILKNFCNGDKDSIRHSYNLFYRAVKENKKINKTIDTKNFFEFFKFFDVLKVNQKTEIASSVILFALEEIHQIIIDGDVTYKKVQKIFNISKSLLERLDMYEDIFLSFDVIRAKSMLMTLTKYSIAIMADLKIIDKYINKDNLKEIECLIVSHFDIPCIIKNYPYKKEGFELIAHAYFLKILERSSEEICIHHDFVLNGKNKSSIITWFEESERYDLLLNFLLFYDFRMFNFIDIYLTIINTIKSTVKNITIIDLMYFYKNDVKISDFDNILHSQINRGIMTSLALLINSNTYNEEDLLYLHNCFVNLENLYRQFLLSRYPYIEENRKLNYLYIDDILDDEKEIFYYYIDYAFANEYSKKDFLNINNINNFIEENINDLNKNRIFYLILKNDYFLNNLFE